MALITCHECGREISDKATSCPACGYPIQAGPTPQNGTADVPAAPTDAASMTIQTQDRPKGSKRGLIIALSAVIILVAALIIAAQLSAAPGVEIENGAYTCTPQELIDIINKGVVSQNSDEYLKVPDYVASLEKIEVYDHHLELILAADNNGKLKEVTVQWYEWGIAQEQIVSAGFYAGTLLGIFSPGMQQELADELEIGKSTVEYDWSDTVSNGSYFEYSSMNGLNSLTINPE